MGKMFLKKAIEVSPGLLCRLLHQGDLPQINQLIATNYSYQYPMRRVFKVTEKELGDFDVRAAKENLKSNASLGTFVKKTGELIAIEMNTIHDVTVGDHVHTVADSERLSSELRMIKMVLGDVFADLKTSRYIRGRLACVKSDHLASGLFTSLEDLRMELARRRGCEYLVAVVGSYYTQRAAKRAGYSALREIRCADFVDPETGLKPDLELSPVHTSCQLVYKKIPPAAKTKQQPQSKL